MYVWYNHGIDWFKYIFNVTRINNNCFYLRVRILGSIFCCIITFYFLNFTTYAAKNLKPLNTINKSISLFFIADLVSLKRCSPGLKEFKISLFKNFHNRYKHEIVLLCLYFFLKGFLFFFFISPYKRLSEFLPAPVTWETSLSYLIILNNLWEVECSIVIDFMSIMFGLYKDFGC